jgi:diguanylate cyclase (GGDEF)-like protein
MLAPMLDAAAGSILIVDDSATMRAALETAVRAMKMEPIVAESGERALELFASRAPSLVLLDVVMPGIDGYETARRMRAARPGAWVPIIFLSSSEYDQNLERAIECGGDDYLVKPVSAVVLSAKVRALRRLEEMQRQLEALSNQDALTGIANRRAFESRLALALADTARRKEPLALALCDADDFKAYNDRYGHPAGDACLRDIAAIIASCCVRATDLAARYGGEEFALLLPATPVEGALTVLERARARLAERAIAHEGSRCAKTVTLSIGLAMWRPEDSAYSLVARADEALYRAKAEGRNRVAGGEP